LHSLFSPPLVGAMYTSPGTVIITMFAFSLCVRSCVDHVSTKHVCMAETHGEKGEI
jgi:hypothetical protein